MYNISGIGRIREKLWVTSDTDFFLTDIDEGLFYDPKDRNDYIIEMWNRCINKRDVVYHLGNFSSGSRSETEGILKRLNGRINLLVGSSDTSDNVLSLKKYLASCNYRLEIQINEYFVSMNHYPQRTWYKMDRSNSFMLHGNTKGEMPAEYGKLILDVSLDAHDMKPIEFSDVVDIIENKKKYIELSFNRIAFDL